jgi:hypothetical protein
MSDWIKGIADQEIHTGQLVAFNVKTGHVQVLNTHDVSTGAKNAPIEDKKGCFIGFKGNVTKDQLYVILDHIDQMKQRGFELIKHERTDLKDNITRIDYKLKLK